MFARPPIRLIYIAAMPYTGSTILTIALGNSPGVLNLGEVNYLEKVWHAETKCYCFDRLEDCAFWAPIRAAAAERRAAGRPAPLLEEDGRFGILDQRRMPLLTVLRLNLGAKLDRVFNRADIEAYVRSSESFFEILQETTGETQFVDASKNLRRLAALRDYSNLSIKVIILRRAASGLLASRIRRLKRKSLIRRIALFPLHLVSLGLHFLSVARMKRSLKPGEYYELDYEDFRDDPKRIEGELSDWLGIDVDFRLSNGNMIADDACHIFTGSMGVVKRPDRGNGIKLRRQG